MMMNGPGPRNVQCTTTMPCAPCPRLNLRSTKPFLETLAVFLVITGFESSIADELGRDLKHLKIQLRTGHYDLSGTVSEARFAEYGRCLEYIHKEYASGFAELTGKQTAAKPPRGRGSNPSKSPAKKSDDETEGEAEPRFPVVILATADEYQAFGGKYFGGRVEHTRGLYVPSVKLLLIRDEADSAETYEVLFHEAFHQFMHHFVPAAPIWVNEGLATYYGTARVTSHGLAFDRPRSEYADLVASAASARQLIPLHPLMTADATEFYSGAEVEGVGCLKTQLCYAQSYTLVAYMLSEPEGADHLRRYLRELAAVKSPNEARAVTLKVFPEALLAPMVDAWLRYVNRH